MLIEMQVAISFYWKNINVTFTILYVKSYKITFS